MEILLKQAANLLDDRDLLAALGNFSALIFYEVEDLNWVGFYRLKNDELVLGPFNGKVACSHLSLKSGVCALSVKKEEVVNVKNVHDFKGHIACDTNSQSELVLPLYQNKKLWGVLDIDSPKLDRFKSEEVALFKKLQILLNERLTQAVFVKEVHDLHDFQSMI